MRRTAGLPCTRLLPQGQPSSGLLPGLGLRHKGQEPWTVGTPLPVEVPPALCPLPLLTGRCSSLTPCPTGLTGCPCPDAWCLLSPLKFSRLSECSPLQEAKSLHLCDLFLPAAQGPAQIMLQQMALQK